MASMNLIERKKINPNVNRKEFPLLAVEQFERVLMAHNVEFRGGFYMNSSTPSGETREVYVPDTREVFCNTCEALSILVSPAFSKVMKEKWINIKEKLKELEKKFLDATSVHEDVVLGESFYEKEEDKILLEEYNNMKVQIYRELFQALSNEFSIKRYYSKSSGDD